MRKIDYHIAVTLDGYICHDDGSIDDFLMEGEHADEFVQSLENYDTVLMGRGTYEFGFQFGLKPGNPAYPNLKHYIFSQSLTFESSKSVVLVQEQALPVINDLKNTEGKDIWLCGGGHFASFLLENDLIDRLTLKVNPVLFGAGRKLVSHIKTTSLKLISHKAYSNGVVLNQYLCNR